MTAEGSTEGSTAARTGAYIGAAVRRTLRDESHRNEVRLAYVRSVILGLNGVTAWLIDVIIEPQGLKHFWVDDLVASLLFFASVLVLLVLRRRQYSPHLWIVVPISDTCTLLVIMLSGIFRHGPALFVEYEIRATLALAVAAIAMSGGVRLHSKAAYFTTGLAMAAYLIVAAAVGWKQIDVLVTALLGGLGYFGIWFTRFAERAAEDEVARAVLGRFLPASVIEQAHRDPLALLENPRSIHATVLVSDIRGFTSFAEAAPPDEVFEVLNRVHGAMADVVQRCGGVIDKFTGDGMLSIFGLATEDEHATNALTAATGMREAAEGLRSSLARYNLDLQLGMALHSGHILVGCVGGEERLEFTVIGDAVNTTFRLQDLTKAYGVDLLVSQETVTLVNGAPYDLKPLGSTSIRGRAQTLDLFTVPRGARERDGR